MRLKTRPRAMTCVLSVRSEFPMLTFVPSSRMTFSGGEIRKLRGSPRHCRPMRARYVLGLIAPFCSPLMLRARVTADAAIPPILLIASQMATIEGQR